MARCTAPVEGHRSSSAAAACPACRGSYGRRYGGYSGYGSGYSSSYASGGGNGNSTSFTGTLAGEGAEAIAFKFKSIDDIWAGIP